MRHSPIAGGCASPSGGSRRAGAQSFPHDRSIFPPDPYPGPPHPRQYMGGKKLREIGESEGTGESEAGHSVRSGGLLRPYDCNLPLNNKGFLIVDFIYQSIVAVDCMISAVPAIIRLQTHKKGVKKDYEQTESGG